jgi:Protein of unknown function (DUF3306)
MSDDESFLARWSRRKQSAEQAKAEPKPVEAAEPAARPPAGEIVPPAETEPAVDLASLPPIESIGPDSDVRAFLAPGVPAHLTRAALRRAWSSDPAIRDFIGLVENGWDFNAPDGEASFGSLTGEEARRLLSRFTGAPAANEPAQAATEPTPAESAAPGHDQEQSRPEDDQGTDNPALPHGDKENIAMQQKPEDREYNPVLPRRGHGGALPE